LLAQGDSGRKWRSLQQDYAGIAPKPLEATKSDLGSLKVVGVYSRFRQHANMTFVHSDQAVPQTLPFLSESNMN
jgi:hypothetical protein